MTTPWPCRHWREARLSVFTALLLASAHSTLAQDLGPVYRNKINFNASAAYSHIFLDPALPRDLKNHENHLDDAVFLTGSPGVTDLSRLDVDAVEIRIGLAYRLGFRNLAFILDYAPRFPVSSSGRLEIQQANDPRPPAIGSFVYSSIPEVGIAHAARPGLGFATRLSDAEDWSLETQAFVDIGRWNMTFEKGWSRFGRDQAAITSRASGFEVAPGLAVSLRSTRWSIFGGAQYMRVRFRHESAHLEDHTGAGFAMSFGGRFHPG